MPLIRFKATTILNAFILNSIAVALIASISIIINNKLVSDLDKQNKNGLRIFYTMLFSFIFAFIIYGLLYLLFGYGRGMLAITTNT